MKTIYIDIGSRGGQQIGFALQSVDHVYGFEPSPSSYHRIHKIFVDNPRVTLHQFGLWNKTCEIEMINEGAAGGTIFQDYQSTGPVPRKAMVKMIKASDWFRDNLTEPAKIIMKINCEGGECDIINDLLDSGEYSKIHTCLIDFDVRKCPSKRHEELKLITRLKLLEITNVLPYMMINDNTPLDRKIIWKNTFGDDQK